MVTTALPAIQQALDTSLTGLQWTVNAYALTFAVVLLTGAALGDLFGGNHHRDLMPRQQAGDRPHPDSRPAAGPQVCEDEPANTSRTTTRRRAGERGRSS